MKREIGFLLAFFFACLFSLATRDAVYGQDQFYKGKTIRIMVGSTPGGFYDRWGRLLAKFMGK